MIKELILIDGSSSEKDDTFEIAYKAVEYLRPISKESRLLFRVREAYHILNFAREVDEIEHKEIHNIFVQLGLIPTGGARGTFVFNEETLFHISLMLADFHIILQL